jgi:hypothetical protein
MKDQSADLKDPGLKDRGQDRPDASSGHAVSGHAEFQDSPPMTFGGLDVILLFLGHWKWLVFGPLLAGILAYSFLYTTVPKRYISSTTLLLNDTTARTAESFMLSPAALDIAIASHADLPGESLSQKRRLLSTRIKWSVTPGDSRKTATIFYMTVEDTLPTRAQSVARILIEQWLILSKPRPDAKARLEADLERTETRLAEADVLLQRLSGETKSIIAPNSLQGEFATPIERLRENRNALVLQAQKLRVELAGGSRDAILTAPDLSLEPSTTRSGPVGLAAGATLCLFLLFIIGRYWLQHALARDSRPSVVARFRRAVS